MMHKTMFALAAAALLVVPSVQAQTPVPVDLELALLVDVSGSVDNTEFTLQRDGYVAAFGAANGSFWDAFESSGRQLAVSFTYWSSGDEQSQLGGLNNWFLITDATSAQIFATAIGTFANPFGNNTGPGSAINYIVPQFGQSFLADRQVIDVSGDGCENSGDDTSDARDAAEDLGITINGLVIGSATLSCGSQSLSDFYADDILTGDGFLESAANFTDFQDAIVRKVGREVGGTVPEPATMTLLATGLVAIAATRRRKKQK